MVDSCAGRQFAGEPPGPDVVTPGEWQHLALVHDLTFIGGIVTLLLNAEIYSFAGSQLNPVVAGAGIGDQFGNTFPFSGLIDEVYFPR